MNDNASFLFAAGQLDEAIAAAASAVKSSPTDSAARGLLAELLCIAGSWDRADIHLEFLFRQADQSAPTISLVRQLVRAAQARSQFFAEGRLPEFLTEPPAWLKWHLEASVHIRDGNSKEALACLEAAQAAQPALEGTCNGTPFSGFRDLDDLTSGLFEVMTSTGKYFWIPMSGVEAIEFHPPQRPRDLIWRRVRMCTTDCTDGEVFLPALYPLMGEHGADIRMGKVTEWAEVNGAPVRGLGQRVFLAGEMTYPVMELVSIAFNTAP